MAHDLDPPVQFREFLNVWDVKLNPQTQHWAVAGPLAALELRQAAASTFLQQIARDDDGHRFFQIVGDMEADDFEGGKLTLEHLSNDHSAWVGA
jgi:hypothetical protein